MPLERLELWNFQKHRRLAVEFDPRITSIVGPTEAGKTTVLRALRWLAQNYPAGNEFIRDGTSFCKAKLTVDGHTVVRKIGKQNIYRLDGKVFKAFGRNAPAEVVELLGLADENFQDQLDAPFWFSLTPGQLSLELNRIVNLDVIDKTLAWLGAAARQAKAEAELTRERLREAKTAKRGLAWVPAAAQRLSRLQAKAEAMAAKRRIRGQLADLLQKATQSQTTLRTAARVQTGAEHALAAGAKVLEVQGRRQRLHGLLTEIKTGERKCLALAKQKAKAEKRLHAATKGKRCPVCGKRISSPPMSSPS